jgi:O-antigen/teichoic acid export membrane protein
MLLSLKEKVFSGLVWRAMERFGTQAIQFVLTIVLARLLEPKDFGTIALLSVFLLLANVFVNSGFGTAIIQKKEIDARDLNSVLYLSLAISAILYGVLFLAAPAIARFYANPMLASVLRWMALGLVFSAINGVQNAVLTREMRFQASFWIQLAGFLVYGVVGIGMAYAGYGVWSLVFGSLASRITGVIGCWLLIGWRPKLQFCRKTVWQLYQYSRKVLAATLNDTLFTNIYNLIIGKLYNPEMLGFYNRGQSIPLTVMGSVSATISGVIFPALSQSQENKKQMRAMTRRMILTSSFLVFPAMLGLAVVAKPLVMLLLTEKWLPCVPFLQWTCINYAFWPLHEANLQVILASGRSDLYLKLEFIKKPLVILVILLTWRHGVLAMVIGQTLLSPLCIFINAWPNKKLIAYSALEQIRDISPIILLSTLMGVITFGCSEFISTGPLLLTLQILIGTIVYFGLSVVFRVEAGQYIILYLFEKWLKEKREYAVAS